jgi:hypothetical protein
MQAPVLTDQHIAEALSRAYVRAIAGRAGVNLAIREYDYGVDGSFDEVVVRRRMVMTPEVLSSYPQIQELHVAEVVDYLQQHHWIPVSHPSPRLLVFEKGLDDRGKPIQIVLPSKDDYEDTPYLLAKAVNLLSVLESVSFQEIVTAIDASAHVI